MNHNSHPVERPTEKKFPADSHWPLRTYGRLVRGSGQDGSESQADEQAGQQNASATQKPERVTGFIHFILFQELELLSNSANGRTKTQAFCTNFSAAISLIIKHSILSLNFAYSYFSTRRWRIIRFICCTTITIYCGVCGKGSSLWIVMQFAILKQTHR